MLEPKMMDFWHFLDGGGGGALIIGYQRVAQFQKWYIRSN